MLLHQDRNLELLETGGTIIGVEGLLTFEEEEKQLQKGDEMVLYTDGATKYQDDAGAFFGPGRRYELLEMHKDRPIAKNLDRVYDDMMTFGEQKGLKDDVRLLGIEFG